MTLEEILSEWDKDAVIDRLDLTAASLDIPKLHAKYYRTYIKERARLVHLNGEYKQTRLDKYEFYIDGPHSETPSDWELPAKGRIIKADVERYLDADKHLLDMERKVELQKEKVKFLESILYTLNTRNYVIKNAIDMIKFEAGER